MTTTLEKFLRHGFDQLFCDYSPQWVDLAAELYGEVRGDLLEDAAAHSPHWREEKDFDAAFFRTVLVSAPFQATLLYRLSHALFLRDAQHPALPYLAFFLRARTSMEIYYSAAIAPGFRIMHGAGTVIGPRHRIGQRFTIYQNVTLGQRKRDAGEFVTVGDDCSIYAGAKVIGMIRIGDNVKIGANSVLLTDAERDSTYAGSPAKKIQ